jgi:hypothetical protein
LRIVRTPRTVQMVAHLHSSSRGWLRLVQSARASFRGSVLLGAASREFTGQGPRLGCITPHNSPQSLQSQSLTTGASPQPDRPGHLLSQARDVEGRRPLRRRGSSLSDVPHVFQACPTSPANAVPASQDRFPRCPAKDYAFRLNPRCLPLPDMPRPGLSQSAPQSVPSLWSR